MVCNHSIMALRKAEKEEEKRAREKIRQKLEEDKVSNKFSMIFQFPFIAENFNFCYRYTV